MFGIGKKRKRNGLFAMLMRRRDDRIGMSVRFAHLEQNRFRQAVLREEKASWKVLGIGVSRKVFFNNVSRRLDLFGLSIALRPEPIRYKPLTRGQIKMMAIKQALGLKLRAAQIVKPPVYSDGSVPLWANRDPGRKILADWQSRVAPKVRQSINHRIIQSLRKYVGIRADGSRATLKEKFTRKLKRFAGFDTSGPSEKPINWRVQPHKPIHYAVTILKAKAAAAPGSPAHQAVRAKEQSRSTPRVKQARPDDRARPAKSSSKMDDLRVKRGLPAVRVSLVERFLKPRKNLEPKITVQAKTTRQIDRRKFAPVRRGGGGKW